MPVINVEDLTDKDKAVMEVNQLKIEVKLERWLVSCFLRWGDEYVCAFIVFKDTSEWIRFSDFIHDKQFVNLFECNYTKCN